MSREIDDVYIRKQYKEAQFKNRKSRIDDYTGERVFSGNVDGSKYKHPSHKTSDTDHITPINVVEKRYKYLSKDQQKKLVNNKSNFATVNSKLNRSKGDLENHQYLLRQAKNGKRESFKTSSRMLSKEIESRTIMRAEATMMSVQNTTEFISERTKHFISENLAKINHAGFDEAMTSATFAATLSVTKNAVLLYRGEEDIDDALMQIIVDTSASATLGYMAGVSNAMFGIGDVSSSYLLVNSGVLISKQVFSYVEGNIDERQLIENIASSSAQVVCAYIGKTMGEVVGNMMIPGIGKVVGQYIGEVITTAVCTEVIATIKYNREFEKYNKRLAALYNQAESEIRKSQNSLKELAERENKELICAIQTGFDEINTGLEKGSYKKILDGIVKIGKKFGLKREDIEKEAITKDNLESRQTIVLD